LFNITADPCELLNVASQHPKVVEKLVGRLAEFQETAVEDGPYGCDPVMVDVGTDGAIAWRPCDMVDI
jgi:urea transporter